MARPPRIGAAAALAQIEGWRAAEGRDAIQKSYKFADFSAAFAFMARVALKAEQMDHHPEWANIYSRIDVTLTTHDAAGVTRLDIELAQFMDTIAGA
jgi:4a-hydroxytetrahydrobiopterin dehydratase